MAEVVLTLLGRPEITPHNGGASRPVKGRKTALLVCRLACPPGRRQTRAALQATLWPGSDEARAQGSLRFSLHQLRAQLGPALQCERVSVWLDPSKIVVDAARFERLAAEGTLPALTQACSLYRGDLLDGIAPEGEEEKEWLLPERERLQELARDAFWARFRLLLWRGEIAEAERCAVRALEIEPYCERMNAALLRLRIDQGRRAAAARQYASLTERLWRDLQVRPGRELEAVAAELTTARPPGRRPLDPPRILGRPGGDPLDAPPLVAVVPFRDLTDDGRFSALSLALTEDVIGDLARFRRLAVLGRATALGLASRRDAGAWLRGLGVRYLVEGSIRSSGNRFAVSVELAERASGRCLWAGRFRGDLGDLPEFQEETARAIVASIQVQVEIEELARIRHLPIESLTAYELYLRGREQQRAASPKSVALAFRCFAEAIEREPDFAAAHAALALSYFSLGACDPSEDGGEKLHQAIGHSGRAIVLDPLAPAGHWMHGMLLQMLREFAAAQPNLERAVALAPGDAETLAFCSLELAYAGDAGRGAALAYQAMRLEPGYPPVFAELIGKTEFIAHRYGSALFWLRQSPDRVPTNRAWLAATAARAGRTAEAAAHARAARSTLEQRLGARRLEEVGGPIAWLRGPARFLSDDDLKHYEEALRESGLN